MDLDKRIKELEAEVETLHKEKRIRELEDEIRRLKEAVPCLPWTYIT